MKKYITTILIAIFTCFSFILLPLSASAAGKTEGIELKPSGKQVSVQLTLPNADGEKVSSVQLTIKLDAAAVSDASFTFSQDVTAKAKVHEAYYDKEKKTMNLYIAGTKPLYTEGVDTLTLGSVTIDGSGSVDVHAGDVKIVRGPVLENKNLSADQTVQLGSSSSSNTGSGSGSGSGSNTGSGSGSNSGSSSGSGSGSGSNTGSGNDPGTTKPGDNQTPPTDPVTPPTDSDPETPAAVQTPKLSKAKNAAAGVTITWTKSSNAAGYYVYRKTPGGKWKRIATLKGKSKASYTDKAVKSKNGKTYIYTVKAYNGKDNSSYNKAGLTVYRLTAPEFSKTTSKASKKMVVKWKKNAKATGYQIQYATSADFSKGKEMVTVKPAKTISKTISALKSKKEYYVRVRSYKKTDGTNYFSAWSKTGKVKIK